MAKSTNPAPATVSIDKDIIAGVRSQIDELESLSAGRKVKTDAVLQQLINIRDVLGGVKGDNNNVLLLSIIKQVTDIQTDVKGVEYFGITIGDLNTLAILAEGEQKQSQAIEQIIAAVQSVLNYRPNVQAVIDDLEAIKNLRGGPADATAFHDFNVLQIAFKSVWKHAFDQNLQSLVEQLYLEHTKLFDGAGIQLPPFDAIMDIGNVNDLMRGIQKAIGVPQVATETTITTTTDDETKTTSTKTYYPDPPVNSMVAPPQVTAIYPFALHTFPLLSSEQQLTLFNEIKLYNNTSLTDEERERHRITGQYILENPDGPGGRIAKLIYRLNLALSEPYAFDVFAPHTYNFGIMLTYRQKWQPGAYQAGNLISTLPLAPGETRKYSKKQTIKRSRSFKEVEKSLSTTSLQSTEIARAEADIMAKTTLATNFKMSASGSFNIGIGSINSASEFGINQGTDSTTTKKSFHEATIKAAEEYRLERNLEVDTLTSEDIEQTSSGEISNPNNEITVTYLFYELQRRYRISEFLYRARPVILVALDVPAPHEIDEAWLIQYQWILARVLLDDSFRTALNYLSSGFAGDEVGINILKAQWKSQLSLMKSLEGQVQSQLDMRNSLRESLVQTALQKKLAEAFSTPTVLKVLSLGMAPDPGEKNAEVLEANREAMETRLKYVEESLADAQDKLKQASDTFQQITKDYTAATQNQFSRHVAIDQLRIHVKQNILYYMQAIWSHQVADQQFFELYKLPIELPTATIASSATVSAPSRFVTDFYISARVPAPSANWEKRELVELADLDNPLGFKGNYIIFPLKEHCYLTDYMLNTYLDEYTKGLKDPDEIAYFLENFPRLWDEAQTKGTAEINKVQFTPAELKEKLKSYVSTTARSTEEIIVPTGQLFIEALPGTHPLLEDFKMEHRFMDINKVKAEVRRAELENLRLAERILEGKLEDPDIEKKIVVQGNAGVTVDSN